MRVQPGSLESHPAFPTSRKLLYLLGMLLAASKRISNQQWLRLHESVFFPAFSCSFRTPGLRRCGDWVRGSTENQGGRKCCGFLAWSQDGRPLLREWHTHACTKRSTQEQARGRFLFSGWFLSCQRGNSLLQTSSSISLARTRQAEKFCC